MVKGLNKVKVGQSVKVLYEDSKGNHRELKGVLYQKLALEKEVWLGVIEPRNRKVEFIELIRLSKDKGWRPYEIKPARLKAGQRDLILKHIGEDHFQQEQQERSQRVDRKYLEEVVEDILTKLQKIHGVDTVNVEIKGDDLRNKSLSYIIYYKDDAYTVEELGRVDHLVKRHFDFDVEGVELNYGTAWGDPLDGRGIHPKGVLKINLDLTNSIGLSVLKSLSSHIAEGVIGRAHKEVIEQREVTQ